MRSSLEFETEAYFIELFRTDQRLKGKNIVHADGDGRAEMNGIVVEATAGEPELDGAAGANVEVIATWRGGSKSTAERNDLVAAAMTEVVNTANTRTTTAQLKFATPLVILNEQMTADRPDTKNSRKRVLKIPVIAKLADRQSTTNPYPGGMLVSGGTQDGIYDLDGANVNGRAAFTQLGYDDENGPSIWWDSDNSKWIVSDVDGNPTYYSVSNVATPDLAANWKNASDDTPASVTVELIT